MISYADAKLVGELLSISVYTVYAIIFDGSCLTHFMTTATLMRKLRKIQGTWVQLMTLMILSQGGRSVRPKS